MAKRFNMLALIVLLVFQTMLAPVAATAQGLPSQEDAHAAATAEDQGNDDAAESSENGDSENGETTDADEEEAAEEEATSEGDDGTNEGDSNDDAPEENTETDGEVGGDGDDPEGEPDAADTEELEEDTDVADVQEGEPEGAADEISADENDEDRDPQQITENIIDELRLIREDGSVYEEGDSLELDEDLRIELDWSLPNGHEYQAGDTFEFQLPDALTIYNDFDGDLDGYGTYHVTTNGLVTFTFSEKIESESDIKGTFWTDTELDEQVVKKTTEELEIIFNDEVIEKITINVKPKDGQAIQKNGQPVNGNFNTEEIKWTVIVNTTREALENAVVNDPILDGQELILNSIDVKEVEVNLEGHVEEVLDGDVSFTDNSSGEELNLHFGNTAKAYQITFRTKMTEEEKDKEGWTGYSNTAYLNSDGKDEAQSGASVSVERPESLTKTSSDFNKEDRSVEWTVNANFTEKELSAGSEIVDEFTFTIGNEDRSDAFEITLDDIDIQQVDSFGDNGAVGDTSDAKDLFNISISDEGNKVTYTLKEASNKAFVIKYKTTAKDGAYINDDGTISNTVSIDGKTETSSTGVGQQVGVKTNSGINYENKTIDWTITVNADSQVLNGFVLTDDFSDTGQKLVDGSIKIDPGINESAIVPNEDGEGFVINFGDINQPYTITYQTEFTYDFGDSDEKPSFRNGVKVEYETTDEDDYDLEFGDNVNPNEETRSNGAKNSSVNNETKEITWMIDINYNQLELEDAKLIDEIADNQSLVEGSVAIYPTTISDNGTINVGENAVEDFDVNIIENDDGNEEVNIDFGSIDQSYRVVFITKDKDGIYNSNEVYENTAQFIPREGETHNLTANATLPNQGEFLGKNGHHNRDDWTIDWELTINESKSTLTDATVTDNLGDESLQILLEDSIEVTKVGSDDVLVEGEDYELVVDGNELSVTFPGVITDTYSINYSAYILAAETADISNEAAIKSVEDTIVGNVESEETVQVRISTGGGSGEGTTGELVLKKVESDTNRPLDNVAFKLVRTVGGQEIVVREDTTDEDGKIHWTGLQFGDYTLEEVVPEGYLGEESQEITLSSDAPEGIQTITIENERQTGIVAIEKVDAHTGEKLDDAVFEITNLVTGQTYTLTTEDDGTVSEEVPFGEYTVEEIAAPNGYRITKDIENITIVIDETITIEVVNVAFVDVAGQKTWISDDDLDLPAITVELLANGTKVDDTQVSADTDWAYSFTNLDKYDENGEEIEYTIEEVEVDGFITQQDGFDLTNIQTANISGEKNWVEVDEQYRPDFININLLAGEEEVASKEVEADDEGEWNFTFEGLPKYDTEGNEIEYTIEEVSVVGYTSEVVDFTITNTQETTELSGTKTWLDDEAEDRPETITVQVKNGDTVVQEKDVAADDEGEWNYTFTNLPKYDKEGNEITYTIDEEAVEGYEKSVTGNDITNLRVGETEVVVTKLWNDEDENDRPETITINLLQNSVHYDEYEVTAENNWERTITNLPKYDDQGAEYEYTITEHDVGGYAADVDGFNVTNTRADVKTIEINKSWLDDDSEDRPESIEVELFRSITDGELESVDTYTVTAEDDWSLEVKDLPAFDNDGKAYTYEIEEVAVDGYETTINGFDITNLRVGTTEVEVTKLWKDENEDDRPDAITINLLQNGEQYEEYEVTAENNWALKIEDLPHYDENGVAYEYTITEHDVAGYNSEVDGFEITNTRTDAKSIEINKSWLDDNSEDRPASIEIELFRSVTDGDLESVENYTVTANNDWSLKITDLPAFDKDGKAYTYEVAEKAVEGYETTIHGFDITNLRVDKTEVSGTKTWLDDDSEDRPESITVNLLVNGEVVDSVEVTAGSNWEYEFTELDKYDEQGEKIVYSVDEEPVEGYEKSIEGNNITNLRVDTTAVEVTKLWQDEDESDRPESITINLFQNGEFYEEYKVTEENDWKLTIEDLPQYDEEGVEYKYTITEHDVAGYTSEVDDFEITNTRTGMKTIEITKTWLDDESEDRPDSIEVELFRSITDGDKKLVETYTVNANDEWSLEVTDLPMFDNDGKAYTYEIEEKTVEGYEATINGFDITNLRVGETKVTGTKTWLDDDSNERPKSITVNLLANEEVVDSVEVTAETNWEYEFTNLDKYDDQGAEITYTVDEADVPAGYEKSIEGNNITNLRVGTTEVEITKLWQDEDETDRPDTITINLLQNGDFYEEYEVTQEDDWKLTITDLPQYDEAGKTYEYTVTEHDVAGYAADVDGFEITNTRTDEKSIKISKSWLDTEETANRPDAIEVDLFRSIKDGDKELVETYTVTAENDWSLEITELPTFDNDGKAYAYEIEEKAVEGYESTINGFDITNLRVGETEVTGTKTWLDDDSEVRPETITVQLLANGEETDKTVEVTAETEWKYEFIELPKYDQQGVEITYTIDEVDVPEGYEKSINGNDILNVRVGTTEVSGEKSWVEVDEQYRPDSITVNLLANGEELVSTEASAETDWKFTFTDLAKYDAEGKEIEYTIEEVEVPGYVSEVDEYNITNTQETTEITGTKTWKDDNATDRPDSITVQVMNGADVVQEQEVTAEEDWNFTFIDLAKYDTEGKEVEYTINELPVPGYATEIDGFDITNTRADVLDIAGTKTWKDDNAEDRPASITVQLLANGEVVDSIEVTAETDWTYIFENKDGYDTAGAAIVYTVAEVKVEGYETSINGFDITNTLIPVEEEPEEPVSGGEPGGKDPEDPKGDGSGGNLPSTATNIYNLALIGFGLMLLGLILFIIKRKRIE